MPYMIMVSYEGKGSSRIWEPAGLVYGDGLEAGSYVKSENSYSICRHLERRYRAVKISEDDPLLWREREQKKFEDGIYRRPPWHEHYCFNSTGMYEHIDPDDPTKIRFIGSEEDGLSGRYTSMTPGRFVMKYVDSCPLPSLLDTWCAQMGLDQTVSPLLFAKTAEEIITVYTEGPHSCMSYPLDHPNFDMVEYHPVTVYGDSDVCIAYIERYGDITARCLVWPEKKVHGRIYGDKQRLLERLRENDYVKNWEGFTGARIHHLANKRDNVLILPYIDGDEMGVIKQDEEWLVLSNKPHIIAKSPHGVASGDVCLHCGAKDVWLTRYYGPDDDYEEPLNICAEGCKE